MLGSGGGTVQTLEAINAAIESSGMTVRGVSQAMGKSDGYISSVISSSKRKGGGVYSGTLANLAQVCGYTLALVPAGKDVDGMLAIDPPGREDG